MITLQDQFDRQQVEVGQRYLTRFEGVEGYVFKVRTVAPFGCLIECEDLRLATDFVEALERQGCDLDIGHIQDSYFLPSGPHSRGLQPYMRDFILLHRRN